MVSAAPNTIDAVANTLPSAKTDKPLMPCPMVHPIANTPPQPMSTPPRTCATASRLSRNHSKRHCLSNNEIHREPATAPSKSIMPNVK